MPISKRILYHLSIALVVLFTGFALSSGVTADLSKKLSDKVMPGVTSRLHHHISNLEVNAKHYFVLPFGCYKKELYTQPLTFAILPVILVNSIYNILFQPVFICPFTPQIIVNILALPFFLYGSIRYFKKIWPLLIVLAVISFQVGVYDSVVETLIRHGMSCELIYLLIGSAGFADWITKRS